MDGYVPIYPDKESYFRLMDSLNLDLQAVDYEKDGNVVLRIH